MSAGDDNLFSPEAFARSNFQDQHGQKTPVLGSVCLGVPTGILVLLEKGVRISQNSY